MVSAHCLISVAPGKSAEILRKVKEVDGVRSAEAVAGPYDIVARIEVESIDELSRVVFGGIRVIQGVTNTTTLIGLEL